MNKNIKQVFIVFFAYYGITCFSNVYYIFSPFYVSTGATPKQAGIFISIFYLAMTLFRPFGSFILEKIGVKKTLSISSLSLALLSALIVFNITNYNFIILLRSLCGICAGIFSVSVIAYKSMITNSTSRGENLALFTSASMLPMATIIPISEWLINKGYGDLYLILPSIIALICFILSISMNEETKSYKENILSLIHI